MFQIYSIPSHHLLGLIPLVRPLGLSWLVFLARTLEGEEERMKWWGQRREWDEVDMIKLYNKRPGFSHLRLSPYFSLLQISLPFKWCFIL